MIALAFFIWAATRIVLPDIIGILLCHSLLSTKDHLSSYTMVEVNKVMKEEATLKQVIYYTQIVDVNWTFSIAATTSGLLFISSPNQSLEACTQWINHHYPGCSLVQDDEKLHSYTTEIKEYLQGKRTKFTFPIDLQGTSFQLAVWQALCEIPYGQTRSYSDIAQRLNKPAAVRAVGAAIGANPVLLIVPCHRVLGKDGSLTGYRGGLDMKMKLLQLEKASFVVQ